jgi:hypothetical protein
MMEHMWWIFLTIFLLILAVGLFIAGIFTIYFGSGKSRGIGAGLFAGGLIIGIIVILFYHQDILFPSGPDGLSLLNVIMDALVYLISGILGALAAVGLFLLAIMKS